MAKNAFEATSLDPYIIAEIGMNYEGSMSRAKEMISAVARAGGHAAKFQTYKADTLASREHSPAYWDTTKEATQSQHELFQRFDAFGPAQYQELADHCAAEGVDFMSTPFDFEAVDYLEPLVPQFKVASADLTNVPLLRRIARTGKPVIVSVGAATHDEIRASLAVLREAGATQIALLHCVLRYPTPAEIANISAIRTLAAEFGDQVAIGYSDHVPPTESGDVPALKLALAYGATILEKHYTDDRTGIGNDHYHAFDEAGLQAFTEELALMRVLAGSDTPDVASQQAAVDNARRRVIAHADLAAGTVLTEEHLIPLRANVGVEIARWDEVVGAALTVDKKAGEPILDTDISAR
ncbi:N-acetylneuraminate synthase family protein [Microbacterium sp. NPDC096154]|uniref:N-acetylneuraminate synthase family protein n=1 Tax=Microbacterium sp. NPDC096154 TaxID=3155549 RepID=UPI0033253F86